MAGYCQYGDESSGSGATEVGCQLHTYLVVSVCKNEVMKTGKCKVFSVTNQEATYMYRERKSKSAQILASLWWARNPSQFCRKQKKVPPATNN